MKKILEGFSHKKGLYSDTSSLRDVFAFAGYSFPEPFFFGIGEGLGFFYRDGNGDSGGIGAKPPVVAGRSAILELDRRACQTLGCTVKIATSASPRRAQELLISRVAGGQPVMLHADAFFLKYLHSPRSHFGAYSLVVAGIDDAADTAMVADYSREGLCELSLEELAGARASTHRPFPPHHRWFEFGMPPSVEADRRLVMGAIGRNSVEMLNAPVRNCGIGGIYFLASCMGRWEERYGKKGLPAACKAVREAVDGPEAGGGGCFRPMYAAFLEHAADTYGLDRLREVADGYRRAGAMWSQAAKVLAEVECGCTALSEAADLVNAIAALEHELQVTLLTEANLCCRRR